MNGRARIQTYAIQLQSWYFNHFAEWLMKEWCYYNWHTISAGSKSPDSANQWSKFTPQPVDKEGWLYCSILYKGLEHPGMQVSLEAIPCEHRGQLHTDQWMGASQIPKSLMGSPAFCSGVHCTPTGPHPAGIPSASSVRPCHTFTLLAK